MPNGKQKIQAQIVVLCAALIAIACWVILPKLPRESTLDDAMVVTAAVKRYYERHKALPGSYSDLANEIEQKHYRNANVTILFIALSPSEEEIQVEFTVNDKRYNRTIRVHSGKEMEND